MAPLIEACEQARALFEIGRDRRAVELGKQERHGLGADQRLSDRHIPWMVLLVDFEHPLISTRDYTTGEPKGQHKQGRFLSQDGATAQGFYRLADLPPLTNPDLVIVAHKIPQGVVYLVSASPSTS
jgi:hypothetical protein